MLPSRQARVGKHIDYEVVASPAATRHDDRGAGLSQHPAPAIADGRHGIEPVTLVAIEVGQQVQA